MPDRALEAATGVVYAAMPRYPYPTECAQRVIAAYLDSLLRDIPEEAVKAAAVEIAHAEVPEHYPATPEEMAVHYVDSASLQIRATLRSLRTNLGDTVRKGGG